MAQFKIKPWHFIVLAVAIFALFEMGAVPFLGAAYDLTDPATNTSYTCNTTLECYNKMNVTGILTGPPALACTSGLCEFSECLDGNVNKLGCPDGSSITIQSCTDGLWGPIIDRECPIIECKSNSDCWAASDIDCDEELESVQTTCIDYKCTSPTYARCSDTQLFFGKYKVWIIALILLALGIGGFLYAAPRRLFGK